MKQQKTDVSLRFFDFRLHEKVFKSWKLFNQFLMRYFSIFSEIHIFLSRWYTGKFLAKFSQWTALEVCYTLSKYWIFHDKTYLWSRSAIKASIVTRTSADYRNSLFCHRRTGRIQKRWLLACTCCHPEIQIDSDQYCRHENMTWGTPLWGK